MNNINFPVKVRLIAQKFNLIWLFFIIWFVYNFVTHGFPINRNIQLVREIFIEVDEDKFLARPPSTIFNITHKPISAIDILPASPLHGYIKIFSWLMNLVYHIQAGVRKWSPTSAKIESSKIFVHNFLHEKQD